MENIEALLIQGMDTIKERKEFIKENGLGEAVYNLLTVIEKQNEQLLHQKKLTAQLEAFRNYFEDIYGKGIKVTNWHKNEEIETMDGVIEEADRHMDDIEFDEQC